ncbi:Acetyl-CoA C-acetyltransferase [Paramicrosporidium saccamoebae]|uniref:Acetyl-CoA C-acetyltransferase n=1 Tax=Paramicrosporidium saccamoebae TaxID=1246581 RepID=A0A2H9TN67_9FUNG|nr:Acetyl-CoA C-acetyltransferase [Paramicrosporidium saccamoebae]
MERVKVVASHLTSGGAMGIKSPEDVVIVRYLVMGSVYPLSALRTPICRAKKGGFKDIPAEELLAAVLKATLTKTKIDPKLINDVVIGNVLPPGGGATTARMAALYAGFDEEDSLLIF